MVFMKKIRLYRQDTKFSVILAWINRLVTLSCWIAIVIDIIYFSKSVNLGMALVYGMYTPLRYFLFDISPEKIQKRPPSLDRSIPLTIFVRYLGKVFPIPQGNILATITGFLLACARAMVNGYGLLFFDTFTFIYQVRDNTTDNPLTPSDEDSSSKFKKLEKQLLKSNNKGQEERLDELKEEWKQTEVTNSLNVWDFPLRRYLKRPTYYFDNHEVGNIAIDDRYILEPKEDNAKQKQSKNSSTKEQKERIVKLKKLL